MANWETLYTKIIKEIAREEGIILRSFDDWAFYLKKGQKQAYIYGYQFGLDSASTAGVLKDKAAAYEMMKMSMIPAVPHFCIMNPLQPEFSSLESAWVFLKQKLDEYGEIVIKDNLGTGGRSVCRVKNMAQLEKAAHEIFLSAQSAAVCPYIKIQDEYRAVVLDGSVKLLFKKVRPFLLGDGEKTVSQLFAEFLSKEKGKSVSAALSEGALEGILRLYNGWNTVLPKDMKLEISWKHNLGQGAKACVIDENELTDEQTNLIKKVCTLFDLKFASIDMIDTEKGMMILEINGGVMMENIAATSDELYIKAKEIYRAAILRMLNQEE